ncbi:unnamed protein product [Lactuca virosa]|uniref:Uncharacterized protein n=1 Tax=Lactuca virosa TaxID=75947 RepID=A0AAU9NCD9_9ASTR|nr:unnamed protein product [Lactuca virosa]
MKTTAGKNNSMNPHQSSPPPTASSTSFNTSTLLSPSSAAYDVIRNADMKNPTSNTDPRSWFKLSHICVAVITTSRFHLHQIYAISV